MPTATVTSDNQITIPEVVRQRLRLVTGDKLEFYENEQGETVIKPMRGDIRKLRGIFKSDGPPLTVEQMREVVGDAIVAKYKATLP